MIVQLTPDQVAENWEQYEKTISNSLSPTLKGATIMMSNILQGIMTGKMQLWSAVDNNGVQGICLTTVIIDPGTYAANLLIYSLASISRLTPSSLKDGLDYLVAFAVNNNCNGVVAYTQDKTIIDYVNAIGGDTSWTYLTVRGGDENIQ